jgi:hypothetical protein
MRPDGFPQLLLRGNESPVTALSKLAVGNGNPMIFSVPNGTADIGDNSIGRSFQCPLENNYSVHEQISPTAEHMRQTQASRAGNETVVRRDRFPVVQKSPVVLRRAR